MVSWKNSTLKGSSKPKGVEKLSGYFFTFDLQRKYIFSNYFSLNVKFQEGKKYEEQKIIKGLFDAS